MSNEHQDIHKPGELIEEKNIVKAVLNGIVEFWVKVVGFDFSLADVEKVSRRNIYLKSESVKLQGRKEAKVRVCTCSVSGEPMLQVDNIPSVTQLSNPAQEGINSLLNDWLQSRDSLLGKDRIPSCTASPVEIVVHSRYGRYVGAKSFPLPAPHISLLSVCVDLIIKVGVGNMDFFWVDSDDRTIFIVQLTQFEDVLATMNAIIEELVPIIVSRVRSIL